MNRLERWVSLLVVVGSLTAIVIGGVAGCPTTTTGTDAGFSTSQCTAPSACWLTGPQCNCVRGTAKNIDSCKVCDPAISGSDCECQVLDLGAQGPAICSQPSDVCVGRSPIVCPGRGARCLPFGSSCAVVPDGGTENPLAAPPQLVAKPRPDSDGGEPPELEPRCAFVDDVCCPGI